MTSARYFNILLIAKNIALLKEFDSTADKLAAAMVTLELLIVSEMGVWIKRLRDLSWNTRDLSITWNWSVIVKFDALCLLYICKPYDKSQTKKYSWFSIFIKDILSSKKKKKKKKKSV